MRESAFSSLPVSWIVTVLSFTLVFTALARWAKRSVTIASSTFCASVRSVTMIVDLQLPPSESCSSRVSFESRHGTCAFPVPDADSFSITEPNAYNDWLMFLASSFRAALFDAPSVAYDFFDDSIPARSTRLSFADFSPPIPWISFT